jgi:hypothetical protein
MAYDAEAGGDPRGSWCPKCGQPVRADQPSTQMHFDEDPDGKNGLSGQWHSECARPYWDKLTPLIEKLGRGWGG